MKKYLLSTSLLLAAPLTASAALIWASPMDGDATATVGPNGVANGSPVPTADRNGNAGGAVLFNGTDSFYNLGIVAGSLNAGTMAAWVRTDDHGGERGAIAMGVSGGGTANYFTVQDTGSGRWRSDVDDGALRRDVLSDNPVVPTGTWQHLAVTFAIGGNLTMYIDGVPQADVQALGGLTITPLGDWLVGAERTNARFFSGAIDDVRLYDNELSAAEVAALVPEPSTGVLFGLAGAALVLRRRR